MQPQNRQKLLIFVAIAGAALWIGDQFVLTPALHGWQDRAERLASLRKSIANGEKLLDREKALRSRWNSMMTNALPGVMSAAEGQVLQAFDKWSQTSRVSVNSVKPQWKHPDDDYMTLDCRVDASGSLAAVTRFIYEVEHDPMALKVDGIELTTREGDGGNLALALQVSGLSLNSTPP